jgi:hypothetical protein
MAYTMADTNSAKSRRTALWLSGIACLFAFSAALLRYLKTGEVDVMTILGGIALPLFAVSAMRGGAKRK